MNKKLVVGIISLSTLALGSYLIWDHFSVMTSNDRNQKFTAYSECLAGESIKPIMVQSCDRILIGKGSMRPGDLTDSESKSLGRHLATQQRKKKLLYDEEAAVAEFHEKLEREDQEEISNLKVHYESWREGR